MFKKLKKNSTLSSTLGEWHIFGCECLKHKWRISHSSFLHKRRVDRKDSRKSPRSARSSQGTWTWRWQSCSMVRDGRNSAVQHRTVCPGSVCPGWKHSGASHSHTMYVISSAVTHCNSKLTSLSPARNTLQGIKQPHTASCMVWPGEGETDSIHPTSSF